jgi:hypothetical protein
MLSRIYTQCSSIEQILRDKQQNNKEAENFNI